MGANRGAVDAVVAAVGHDLSDRHRNGLPDPRFSPTSKPPVNRIPVAVFGWNIMPRRATPSHLSKSRRHLQRFVSIHDPIANLFHIPRHDVPSGHHRELRDDIMNLWAQIIRA